MRLLCSVIRKLNGPKVALENRISTKTLASSWSKNGGSVHSCYYLRKTFLGNHSTKGEI